MGCDIHGQFIVRQGKEGAGRYSHPLTGLVLDQRRYLLFAMLAGVRNTFGVEPIAEGRGLPEGVKNYEGENPDGFYAFNYGDHSFSWVTLAELRKVADAYPAECRKHYPDSDGENVKRAILGLCEYADAMRGEDEALFVFGFDS